MMGIDVDRVKIIAFMQMGFFAALAGIFLAAEVTYFWPTQGDGMLLTTLAAVFVGGTSVFGGTGTIFGTFIGVIIIGSLEAGIIAIGLTGFWVRFLNGLLITVSVRRLCLHAPAKPLRRSPLPRQEPSVTSPGRCQPAARASSSLQNSRTTLARSARTSWNRASVGT